MRWLLSLGAIALLGLGIPPQCEAGRLCSIGLPRVPPVGPPAARPVAIHQDLPEINVGTQLPFVVSGNPFLLAATCRYVGPQVFVFVEDAQWDGEGGPIDQSDVDSLAELFERSTPADPQRGIYQIGVEAFGPPPDVDGYGPVFLLVLDIGEDNLFGFFDPAVADYPLEELRRDTLYLDSDALRRQRRLAFGTLAHEFQHLIHWGQDPDEVTWVNEGLSGYAEELAGFPEADPAAVPAFLDRPEVGLNWLLPVQASNYGSTYLFFSFLAERYGSQIIRQIVAEQRNDRAGIDEVLGAEGRDFSEVWAEWIAANYAVEDEAVSYGALRDRRAHFFDFNRLPSETVEANVVQQWGAVYVLFRTPGNISVDFDGNEDSRFAVWAYAMRGDLGELIRLDLDEANQGGVEAAGVDSLALIVGRQSPLGGGFRFTSRYFEPTAVVAFGGSHPQLFRLGAAYPNPFNATVALPFSLDVARHIEMTIYNGRGQRMLVLRRGNYGPGEHLVEWDGRDQQGRVVGSGVYHTVLKSGSEALKGRISLIK